MKRDKTQIALGAALLAAFTAFWHRHSPPAKPLTKEEIDYYLEIISKLPLPGDAAGKLVTKLRLWAEADDGKPFYMLNMIRFYDELHRFPGAPEFDGTPEESNAYYEKCLTSLWLKNASYPVLGGAAQGQTQITTHPEDAPWSQAKFVRYPSRRKFLELLSHPTYGPLEPYKIMSMELDMTPVSGDIQVPDPRLVVGGGLLALFLGVGWRRARRRSGLGGVPRAPA
jgi:hypothetical protein